MPVLVPLLYAAAVVWLTWPLGAHLTTHLPHTTLPCLFDTRYTTWALAYETHVLTTAPMHFLDANIYHPEPHTLFYGSISLGALPYFAPVFLLSSNPALAINLTFLASVVLTAAAIHFVVHRWSGSHLAGFIGGTTLLTNRGVLWEFPAWPQYAVLQYFPLLILAAAPPAMRARQALVLVPLLVLQSLAELTYVAPAAFAPLAILALARLARRDTRVAGMRLAGALVLAALVLAPFYAGYVDIVRRNPHLTEQSIWPMHADSPVSNMLPLVAGPTAIAVPALLLVLAGAASRAWRRRWSIGWRHGAWWAVAGILISLRAVHWPLAMLAGSVFLRVPERLAVAGLIGLTILAGLAFAECAARLFDRRQLLARSVFAAVLVTGMYAAYASRVDLLRHSALPAAYPLREAPTREDPIVEALLEDFGPVLELPVEAGGAIFTHAAAMYRSIFHWRPLLNGYASYWPAGFPERMALARRLPDRDALAALRRQSGLATIVVRVGAGVPHRAEWWAIAAGENPRGDLRLLAREGNTLVFSVTDAAH